MKKWNIKLVFATAMISLVLPSQVFADYSLGKSTVRPATAVKAVSTADQLNKITFIPQGTPVFASNAPETLWNGNRPDGSGIEQVNKTLYRDRLTGSFRFWSVHINATAKPLTFYMVVKNTASSTVKLYVRRQAFASGSNTDPAAAAKNATQSFMSQSLTASGIYIASIAPGATYVYPYSKAIAPHQSMDFIGDFRAVNVKTGRDETVTVSDVVTNNGSAKAAAYAAAPIIAQTNWNSQSADDYRGVLKTSARKIDVDLQLTSSVPTKYMDIANGEPFAYPKEQEPLMTVWDHNGKPLKAAEVVAAGTKIRGSYWFMDLTYVIHIQNLTKKPTVYTLYGAAPGMKSYGIVNYRIDSLAAHSFAPGQIFAITDKSDYTIYTMVQPFLSVPLGLYFTAG
jgi:hypothetical protein